MSPFSIFSTSGHSFFRVIRLETYNKPNLLITIGAECESAPRYVHGKRIFFSINTIHTNNFSINKTFVASKISKTIFYIFQFRFFFRPVGSNNV